MFVNNIVLNACATASSLYLNEHYLISVAKPCSSPSPLLRVGSAPATWLDLVSKATRDKRTSESFGVAGSWARC